jgi:hypothetical protein
MTSSFFLKKWLPSSENTEKWFLTPAVLLPRDHSAMSRDILLIATGGGKESHGILASTIP